MSFIYLCDKLGFENKNEKFSVNERKFTKTAKKGNVWVLDIINNSTKEFHLECSIKRDEITLTKKLVDSANTIISDGWAGYHNLENKGYHMIYTLMEEPIFDSALILLQL